MRARTWLIIVGVVAALALAAGTAIVLTRSGDDTTAGQHEPGDAEHGIEGPKPEGADAATAARLALTAMFSWRPVADASPGAGLTRARPWLIGDLATAADAPPATDVRPLPDWAAWRASRDVINASVTTDTVNPPDHGECQVIATVTQTVHHADNSTTRYRVMTVSAVLRDSGSGWRLAAYRVVR